MNLRIVYGAPCSGKTTYVRENIGKDDIVYDYDEISRAITYGQYHLSKRELTHQYVIDFRLSMINRLKNETAINNAWFITSFLTDTFQEYVKDFNPEYIKMDISQDECLARLEKDDMRPDKEAWTEKIAEWFQKYGEGEERSMITKDRFYRAFEIRLAETEMRVEGYAATFDQETVMYEYDGIEYKEKVDRNAFSNSQMQDVVLNYNHQGKPVARTKNKTLDLRLDDVGLFISADLSGTEEGRRLYEEIKGGYIDKMSFAFTVSDQDYDQSTHTRTITGIKRLYDVAAVDIPAYETTSIQARSFFEAEAERERAEVRKALEIAKAKFDYEVTL
jgi:HK97 family phage prohead protease